MNDNLLFIFYRYITILYYLNDVEEGGETAFPVADMKDFNETVSCRRLQMFNLPPSTLACVEKLFFLVYNRNSEIEKMATASI